MQILILMQGPSGSGKSTIAEKLAVEYDAVICSTDSYHFEGDKYVFKADKLGEYHTKNQIRAAELLQQGKSVIVDNTNIFAWQCQAYVTAAKVLGVPVKVVRATGNYANVHGVPAERVVKMREQMEDLEEKFGLKALG